MDSEILIEAEQLSRHYYGNNSGHAIAVDNISFTLKRGEVLGFLGPNGAGKSTTMRMLTGNLAPTHGSIKIAGIDLMNEPLRAKARIGYLPDTPPLYKDLSVNEYLYYCAQLHKISRNQLHSAVEIARQRCGLMEHGKRIINNLSKGYQQRVGIAQAIIHNPDIVILDEPTVGLDPIQMVEIRKLIKQLGQSHSVMISSHILPEIQAICDNVQIINQGKLVFSSSIEQLNSQMQSHILRFSCSSFASQSIDAQKLLDIPGVSKVVPEKQQTILHCFCNSDDELENEQKGDIQEQLMIDIAQQVIQLSNQFKWGLYEIYFQQQSLEDIFMSLTRTKPAVSAIKTKPEQSCD